MRKWNVRCVQGCIQDCVEAFEHQYRTRKERVGIHGQTDVDEQITAATCNEPSRCRWEQDGYLSTRVSTGTMSYLDWKTTYDDEKNVCSFNHCGLLVDEVLGVVWGEMERNKQCDNRGAL